MLVGDPAYKFIHVEDFGYVVSYAPRTSFGDFQTMLPVSVYFNRYVANSCAVYTVCGCGCLNSLQPDPLVLGTS